MSLFIMKRILLSLTVFAFTGSAWAFDEDFGPYKDGETVRPFPVTLVDMTQNGMDGERKFTVFAPKDDPKCPTLRVEGTGDDSAGYQVFLALVSPTGKKRFISPPFKTSNLNPLVFTADLNGDQKPDFILSFPNYSEEGIEGGESYILLSQKKRFLALLVNTTWAKNDFVDLKGDGKCEMICQKQINDHGGQAKNPENKFVILLYRVMGLDGNNLISMDSLDARYPKFVAHFYSAERKNHKETQLLSPDQKKALLDKYPITVSKVPAAK